MKQSNYTFAEGFLGEPAKKAKAQGAIHKAFNWNQAAEIIKNEFKNHPDLKAEAGLQGDWNYTGGIIFKDGKPTNEEYTYLASNWAMPTLILSWDDHEQKELDCWIEENDKFSSDTKWDDESLAILGINI